MPDRYPPIPPSDLTADQKKAYDESSKICSSLFGNKFLYKDSTGAFIGPFSPLLYTPALVDPFFKLVTAIGQIPDFPAAARETAILATGSHFKAGYELYAHGKVAGETTGLSARQIESVKMGVKPSGGDKLDEGCEVAFDVAVELARGGRPLSEEVWKRALEVFGRQGAAALIQYVGVYAYTCVLLNGVDAAVPSE